MESEFFLNAGIPPPPPLQHFDQIPSSTIPTWPPLPPTIEMHGSDCFLSSWEKSTDHGLQFDSALSSLVSSPAASNSNVSNESFMIRELIGKLGNIGGEISPHSQPMLAASYSTNTGNNSTNTSCYSTPLNSPPKVNHNNLHEGLNFPGLSKPPAAGVAEFTADPGFAERAARFSCFGSRSFNGRTNQVRVSNAEFAAAYNGGAAGPVMGNVKLSRVSSSPSLKAAGAQKGNRSLEKSELGNSSQEESTVSELVTNGGEAGLKELNSRKRKASSKGKAKEPVKEAETNDSSDTKRSKPNEGNGSEKNAGPVKTEGEDSKGGSEDDEEKQNNANSKLPEPPKDYIHVRARRGQATDSHSLAERVRREKISERMKLLQDLVPGCNKVTGKALMLDEIINYVQSLQRQVEFLSMKLSSVNPRLDINMDSLTSKDIIFQSNQQLPHPVFPLDSSASAIFGHQPLQNQGLHHTNASNGTTSVDPLDSSLCQNLNLLDGFHPTAAQFSAFFEGDLQSIVQMGLSQNPSRETLQSQDFQGSNQVPHMKVEL